MSGYVHGASVGRPSPTKATGAVPPQKAPDVRMIHVSRLVPNPANIRKNVGDVSELAASIKVHGILEPLLAEPRGDGKFVLLAGHRRLAASKLASLETVPVDVRRPAAYQAHATVVMLVENCQRQDLSAVEKAEAFGELRDGEGWTVAQISHATGFGQSTVSRYLALLDLDDETRERVRAGTVKVGDALEAVKDARAEARQSPAPRPSGSTVKHRKPAKPVRLQAKWLTHDHALAGAAALLCAHDDAPRVGGVACGRCWEDAIRADERTRITRTATPS
jgi:ParB family transcriptional regulator, chromosome partitioning protein